MGVEICRRCFQETKTNEAVENDLHTMYLSSILTIAPGHAVIRLKTLWAAFCVLSTSIQAQAEAVADIPEIGKHERILVVEKNVNPANKLVVYTKVDEKGRFLADPSDKSRPLLDFYGASLFRVGGFASIPGG